MQLQVNFELFKVEQLVAVTLQELEKYLRCQDDFLLKMDEATQHLFFRNTVYTRAPAILFQKYVVLSKYTFSFD